MTRASRLALFTMPPLVGLLGVAGLTIEGRRHRAPIPRSQTSELSANSLIRSAPDARRRIDTTASSDTTGMSRSGSPPPTSPDSSNSAPQAVSPNPVDFEARHQQMLDELAARIAGEPRDSAWSSKTELLLGRAFSPATTPGTILTSSVCRATVCRVTVLHDNLALQRQLGRTIATEEPFASAGAVYFSYKHVSPPTTTLYVLRPQATASGAL
jgi:hypothetical protein